MADSMKTVNKLTPIAERYIPVAQVSFHTEDKLYQIRGIAKGLNSAPDPTDQLISISTNKTISAPAGTFTITLAGDSWFISEDEAVIKGNDLVVISMGFKAKKQAVEWVDGTKHVSSEDLDTVMIGLVDSVTRVRDAGAIGSSPAVNTMITGRDFGKLFVKPVLKFYPELTWDKDSGESKTIYTENGWLFLSKAFTNDNAIKGSPAKILDTVMRFIFKPLMDIEWKVYNDNIYQGSGGVTTAHITNILRYRFAKTNFFIPFYMTAQQFEGAIWNLMSRINLQPFTEMFIDTRDRWEVSSIYSQIPQIVNETCEEASSEDKGALSEDNGKWNYPATMFGKKDGAQVVLVYRNTPFDQELWNKLRTHTITDIDVIKENISRSDNENYNLFWAGSTLTPFTDIDLKRVCPPLVNSDNVGKYGLSPLEVTVEGLELVAEQEDEQMVLLEGLSSNLSAKLKRWYENNLNYLSGTLLLRGKGSIKIGQKLVYSSINKEFYIEGVTQNFQVYGDWETTATITRGATPTTTTSAASPTSAATNIASTASAAATGATTASSSTTGTSYYTVKQGDSLWSIAARSDVYGNGEDWSKIWEANKDMLIERDSRNSASPGKWIYTGQILRIP